MILLVILLLVSIASIVYNVFQSTYIGKLESDNDDLIDKVYELEVANEALTSKRKSNKKVS